MRFCSANGIAPAEVDEVILGRFLAGIPQMNPKPGWIFALLPRFDKTAWRRGRRP
jgi:hypothetical protein